jgi:hypothetical protein
MNELAAPLAVEPHAEAPVAEPPFARLLADGVTFEHHCRTCNAYSTRFLPSYVKRNVRMCNRCANARRKSARSGNRALALLVSLKQRERRRRGATSLTQRDVERLLDTAGGRSAWPLWQRTRRSRGKDRPIAIGIDRIDLASELSPENAVVLDVAQIRARASCVAQKRDDPMPAPLRAAAKWVAAKIFELGGSA